MKGTALHILALTATGAAAGFGIVSLSSSDEREALIALEEKIDLRFREIERKIQESRVMHAAAPVEAPARISEASYLGAAASEEIVRRLEKLERIETENEKKAQIKAAERELFKIVDPQRLAEFSPAQDLKTLQAQATNLALTPEERVSALRSLRREGPGRSREVILSMIDLFRASKDANLRTDIIRNLHHAKEPELKNLLLETIYDPDESVRAKSAEDIDTFLDDPAVYDALVQVSLNDKSTQVKASALEALAKWEKKKKSSP